MSTKDSREDLQARLAEVVAAYGADPARWPVQDRMRIGRFAAEDPAGKQLVQEARAFDQLLAMADGDTDHNSVWTSAVDDLMARVAAEAQSAPAEPHSAKVIQLPTRRTPPRPPSERSGVAQTAYREQRWLPVAAMAASLMLGVFVGATGYFQTTTSSLTEFAGLTQSSEVLQFEDGFGPLDEDYL